MRLRIGRGLCACPYRPSSSSSPVVKLTFSATQPGSPPNLPNHQPISTNFSHTINLPLSLSSNPSEKNNHEHLPSKTPKFQDKIGPKSESNGLCFGTPWKLSPTDHPIVSVLSPLPAFSSEFLRILGISLVFKLLL